MAEDKIADLQRRLDEKLVNPNDLTLTQKEALNTAFEEGTLKGYRSVSDMIQERRLARKDVAEDVRQRLEPLAPTSLLSLGIRRGTLAAAGDIVVGDNKGFSGSVCNVHAYPKMLGPSDAAAFFALGTNCASFAQPSGDNTTDKGFSIFGYTFIIKDKAGKVVQSSSI